MRVIILLVFLGFVVKSYSADHVGIIVKKEGKVELFTNPLQKAGTSPHQVLFDGYYYNISDTKLGTKLENGSVLRTGKDSKVRVIFSNGDQYNVGENTSYKVAWKDSTPTAKGGSVINLMYGQIRAVVSKDGPRNNLKVETKTAAMGVRGTDFFVEQKGSIGAASVSVLRGSVELKSEPVKVEEAKTQPESVTIKVGQGQSATVAAAPIVEDSPTKVAEELKLPVLAPAIKLEQTSRQELIKIQEASVITVSKEEIARQEPVEVKVVEEMKVLEQKALATTLSDIKHYDPKLAESLATKDLDSALALNSAVVEKIFEKAPSKPQKPGLDNLEGADAYKRYFDVQDFKR